MNDEKKIKGSFLLKIESFRKGSQASSLLLRNNDIIVALNNEIFTFGEKALTDELREYQKLEKKSLLTIFRDNVFFDVIVKTSLGCKFSTTSETENNEIQDLFSKKKIYDIEDLKEFVVLRDQKNNFDCFEKKSSIIPALFPPLWLAYEHQWWILGLFSAFSVLLLSVNAWLFMLGWVIISIYCFKAQTYLLYSFSLLSGKGFIMHMCAKDFDEAHVLIRNLYPKSKFKYTRLEKPIDLDEEENEEKNKTDKVKNNIAESGNALV